MFFEELDYGTRTKILDFFLEGWGINCQDISYKSRLKKIENKKFNSVLINYSIVPNLFKLFFNTLTCFYTKEDRILHILKSLE